MPDDSPTRKGVFRTISKGRQAIGKPFAGFEDFEECVTHFEADPDVDDPDALCGWLEEQGKDALEDPDADEILTNLTVEFVSAVDEPAQPSEWLIAKSGDEHEWAVESPLLTGGVVKQDDSDVEQQVAFAPVLVPGEADRQGDVIPPHEIERAAWDYLKHYRKVDSDHDLLDGAGVPVESFTLKDSATFDKPDGSTSREYPDGTWVLGIEFDDETWKRVKDGELQGLSIYGGAKPVDVDALLDGTFADKHEKTMSDNDGNESISKQDASAGEVNAVLGEFKEYAANAGSPDATMKEFVGWLIDNDRIDEGELTGLDVFLETTGSGGESGGDEGEGEASDGEPPDISMSDDSHDEPTPDESNPDAVADGGDPDEGNGEPTDEPLEEIRASLKSVEQSVDGFDDRLSSVEDELSTVKAEVGLTDPDSDRMDGDDGESKRMSKAVRSEVRDLLGIDDDADDDVVRKAFKEQIDKAGDDSPTLDYDGITDDDGDDSSSGGRAASANKRMAGMGDD